MTRIFLPLLLLVASCNRDEQPEAPTAAESEQLNDAETMLNELANAESPAPEREAGQP